MKESSELPLYEALDSKSAVPAQPASFQQQQVRRPYNLKNVIFRAVVLICGLVALVLRYAPENQTSSSSSSSLLLSWPSWPLPKLTASQAEELFLTLPSADRIRDFSRSYTSFAHLTGSEGDYKTVKITERRWAEALGVDSAGVMESGTPEAQAAIHNLGSLTKPTVHVDTYHSLLNYPHGNSSLTMSASNGTQIFKANLTEPPVEGDYTSPNGTKDVPLFHGYSIAGRAEGQLVYANMGRLEDYQALKDRGIDLRGKIALVRYGGSFRGLKISAGEEYGIAGVLIYSDPAEDGEVTEKNGLKPYPEGPARHPLSVQRGSVQKLASYPGDPLTPGQPSYKDAPRLPRDSDDLNLVGVPSLPLSYQDALPLLRSLEDSGDRIPEWAGGLDVPYFTGPSKHTVHMDNQVFEEIRPMWNVYATIPGLIQDEVVILGNHRDAWTYGAGDPNSGSSAVDEIVRSFGVLLEKGWKPLRPILIASWDGEEYGLLGSTEFGEDFKEYLKEKSAIYINVDVAAAGSIFDLAGSPSLNALYKNVTSYVEAPEEPGKTLRDYISDDKGIRPLGSGSDFTVFLQHLGIASSDLSFRPGKKDPVYHYHSIYDSEFWMEKFGDPGFKRHLAASKVLGLAAMRAANSLILPFELRDYAVDLKRYADDARAKAKEAPAKNGSFDVVDFDALDRAVAKVGIAVAALEDEIKGVSQGCPHAGPIQKYLKVRHINQRLAKFERNFLDETGLDGRPWYKHLGVAPGRWAGYGSAQFPGLTEAITLDHDSKSAAKELYRLLRVMDRLERGLRP